MSDAPQLRELFIEDLVKVNGGGPIEDLLNSLPFTVNTDLSKIIPMESTMACGEEANSGC